MIVGIRHLFRFLRQSARIDAAQSPSKTPQASIPTSRI